MKQVFVIEATMAIEFKDGNFTEWDKIPSTFYGFEKYEDSLKELQKLKEEEVIKYKGWLKESKRSCFIHHNYRIENIMIFSDYNDF